MGYKKGQSGNPAGKPPGTANKATTQVREMIAKMADGLAPEVEGWLMKTAKGERDPEDKTKWLVKPDPGYASSLYFQMIEYHIPKLARTEHSGEVTQNHKGEVGIRPQLTREEWLALHSGEK